MDNNWWLIGGGLFFIIWFAITDESDWIGRIDRWSVMHGYATIVVDPSRSLSAWKRPIIIDDMMGAYYHGWLLRTGVIFWKTVIFIAGYIPAGYCWIKFFTH